jgi:hypothetical protein
MEKVVQCLSHAIWMALLAMDLDVGQALDDSSLEYLDLQR